MRKSVVVRDLTHFRCWCVAGISIGALVRVVYARALSGFGLRSLKACFPIFVFALLSQLVVGCSVNKRVSYNDEEGRIPEDVIRKVKRKKTDKSWVLAHLGEPFSIDRVETDQADPQLLMDVYTFRFQKDTAQSGHIFYLLRARGLEQSTEYLHIAFENDKVQKSWLDNYPRPQIGTRIKRAKVNTLRVSPEVEKVSVQPKNSATNWKLPILKKWQNPQDAPSSSAERNNPSASVEREAADASLSQPSEVRSVPAEEGGL